MLVRWDGEPPVDGRVRQRGVVGSLLLRSSCTYRFVHGESNTRTEADPGTCLSSPGFRLRDSVPGYTPNRYPHVWIPWKASLIKFGLLIFPHRRSAARRAVAAWLWCCLLQRVGPKLLDEISCSRHNRCGGLPSRRLHEHDPQRCSGSEQ